VTRVVLDENRSRGQAGRFLLVVSRPIASFPRGTAPAFSLQNFYNF
jgi:hypothetical protein